MKNVSYDTFTPDFNVPADAIDFSSLNDKLPWTPSGAAYIIKAGDKYSGNIKFNNNDVLYIAGEWICTSTTGFPNANKIIILQGGKITVENNSTFSFAGNAVLALESGASLKGDLSIDMQTEAVVYNDGTIDINSLTLKNGTDFHNNSLAVFNKLVTTNSGTFVVNKGTINIAEEYAPTNDSYLINYDEFTAVKWTSEGYNVENNGKIYVTTDCYVQRARVENNCYFEAGHIMFNQGANFNNNQGAALKAGSMKMDGANIFLFSDAMFYCEGEAYFTTQTNNIRGEGATPAIFQANTITFSGWGSASLYGNLYVESVNRTENEPYFNYYTAESSVHFYKEGECDYVIPGGECSMGHNWDGSGEIEIPLIEENNSVYTFAMEDNYPKLGDYDMNDMVFRVVKRTFYKNNINEVEKIKADFELVALGATRKLGLALQLDGVAKSQIATIEIEGTKFTTDLFDITSGMENGQSKVVIPLFDDAHSLFGVSQKEMINTYSSGQDKGKKSISLTITFTSAVSYESIDINKFNLFAVQNNDGIKKTRTEIHVPGFAHTDKTNVTDKTIEELSGLMWALMVPGEFKYPAEGKDIRSAYPKINEWVSSDKNQSKDWYEHPDNTLIYKSKN